MPASTGMLTGYVSGQGVNQAFEDAVILAQAIQDGGLAEASLRAFESQRIPRLQEVMAAEMVSTASPASSLPIHLPSLAAICLEIFVSVSSNWL